MCMWKKRRERKAIEKLKALEEKVKYLNDNKKWLNHSYSFYDNELVIFKAFCVYNGKLAYEVKYPEDVNTDRSTFLFNKYEDHDKLVKVLEQGKEMYNKMKMHLVVFNLEIVQKNKTL